MFDGLFEKLYEMTAVGAFVENPGYLLMLLISFVLLYLGIVKKYEPLLLIPIGFGVLLANLPGADLGIVAGDKIELGLDDEGRMMYMNLFEIAHEYGILNFLYYALIKTGLLPPLIFMGVGAMTDFGPMLRNLKLAFFVGYHRWCRRTYSHLHYYQVGSAFAWSYRYCSIFVHGVGTSDYSSGCEIDMFRKGIENQYETTR